jgi:uncharacterized metal-binding protein (TIGR02443 family)
MQKFQATRRFIAGAVCPRCGVQDKIVIDVETDLRACVACDFTEPRPEPAAAAEPATRVNRAAARLVETRAEPVTLIGDASDDSGQS